MLAVRPGLGEVAELVTAGAEPARWSPWGASRPGDPEALPAIRAGRAGVQDEGSQLVIRAATRAACPRGPWLDLCAGPGGKSALLRGLSPGLLVAAELHPHRAELVAASLRGYPRTGAGHAGHQVIVADGTRPAWQPGSFALVVVDPVVVWERCGGVPRPAGVIGPGRSSRSPGCKPGCWLARFRLPCPVA